MTLNFNELDETKIYKLISNSIFPRPIAWIVTEDEGVVNVAPFSYFAPLSSKPPIVAVSIGVKEDGTPKDTRANIVKTTKATICLVEKELIRPMVQSSAELAKEVSEAEYFNIKTRRIDAGFPPHHRRDQSGVFLRTTRYVRDRK